eukprot:2735785-Alexandrium_andersonii.AAC.1
MDSVVAITAVVAGRGSGETLVEIAILATGIAITSAANITVMLTLALGTTTAVVLAQVVVALW